MVALHDLKLDSVFDYPFPGPYMDPVPLSIYSRNCQSPISEELSRFYQKVLILQHKYSPEWLHTLETISWHTLSSQENNQRAN